jgi:diacylglycerol kinase
MTMVDLARLRRSVSYAWKGIRIVFREEHSFRVQVLVGLTVILAMFLLDLRAPEKALLTLAVAFVLVLELMNSIFERMVDMMKPRIHHYVEDIKDIMAGSVLVASLGAVLIGTMIFWPYVAAMLFAE